LEIKIGKIEGRWWAMCYEKKFITFHSINVILNEINYIISIQLNSSLYGWITNKSKYLYGTIDDLKKSINFITHH